MPIHIIPIKRRRFLDLSAKGAVASIVVPSVLAIPGKEVPIDPHRFAFLSDTHIMANPTAVARGINMADHLRQDVAEVVAQNTKPHPCRRERRFEQQMVRSSQRAREPIFNKLFPLRSIGFLGIPIHLTMGNCDRRSLFADTLTAMLPRTPPVAGRLVNVLKTERANFFLLDSLYNTERTVTEGDLGMEQIGWLIKGPRQPR